VKHDGYLRQQRVHNSGAAPEVRRLEARESRAEID
jgi:hypothetical protein